MKGERDSEFCAPFATIKMITIIAYILQVCRLQGIQAYAWDKRGMQKKDSKNASKGCLREICIPPLRL